MLEISWADLVKNEELGTAKEERNILHKIKSRKVNWIATICVRTAFSVTLLKER
jgi:hypothetical protein